MRGDGGAPLRVGLQPRDAEGDLGGEGLQHLDVVGGEGVRRRPERHERAENAPLHPQRQGGDRADAQYVEALPRRGEPRERLLAVGEQDPTAVHRGVLRRLGVVELDLDTGDLVVDVHLDLVGEPVGHVQPQRAAVGVEDRQRAALRTEDLRSSLHDLRELLQAGRVGQLGGHLGDRRRAMEGRQPGLGVTAGLGDVQDRPEDAHRLAVGVDEHPPP